MLNAKHHEREGAKLSPAGRKGGVTIATNMARRGVDISCFIGPAGSLRKREVKKAWADCLCWARKGTKARWTDNQLRGLSGRQGDPGETQFYISMEDEVMRVSGSTELRD